MLHEGIYSWLDGTVQQIDGLGPWANNQPDKADEDCIVIHKQRLYDVPCIHQYEFLCEIPQGE